MPQDGRWDTFQTSGTDCGREKREDTEELIIGEMGPEATLDLFRCILENMPMKLLFRTIFTP